MASQIYTLNLRLSIIVVILHDLLFADRDSSCYYIDNG